MIHLCVVCVLIIFINEILRTTAIQGQFFIDTSTICTHMCMRVSKTMLAQQLRHLSGKQWDSIAGSEKLVMQSGSSVWKCRYTLYSCYTPSALPNSFSSSLTGIPVKSNSTQAWRTHTGTQIHQSIAAKHFEWAESFQLRLALAFSHEQRHLPSNFFNHGRRPATPARARDMCTN